MYVRSQAPFRNCAYHGYYEAKRLEGEWVLSRSGRNESSQGRGDVTGGYAYIAGCNTKRPGYIPTSSRSRPGTGRSLNLASLLRSNTSICLVKLR